MKFLKPPPPAPRLGGDKFIVPRPAAPNWMDVMKACGYPLDTLVLDAETYFDSDYSLRNMTTIEYIQDKRFEVLGWASKFNAAPAQFTRELPKFDQEAVTVVVFNAAFDALILARKYGVHPKYLIDVLGLARAWNSRRRNDLARLCVDNGLPEKGETENFKGVTFQRRWIRPKARGKVGMPARAPTCTPEQWAKLSEYAINDAEREYDLLKIMLPRLSNAPTEIRLCQHTTELATRPVLMLDQPKGEQIIRDMNAEIDKAIATCGATREEVSGNRSYEEMLNDAIKAAGENPQSYWKPMKSGWKLADAKTDPERMLLLNHEYPRVREVMQARVAIKSWPLHIARVESLMKMAKADAGMFPVPLKYCGAHTGRWSGTDGVNPQNFGSRGHELVTSVRHMIVAPPDHKLLIADSAQIEARVNDWVAGQIDSCKKWEAGIDQYSDFASVVVGYKVRKPRPTDPPPVAKRFVWARNSIGKVGVLGCGYGMGASKTVDYAGGQIDLATAEKIVAKYRETHDQVVKFWRDLEKAFGYTARFHRSCVLRNLRFDTADDCDVILTLPGGRELKYHKVNVEQAQYGNVISVWNATEKHWERTWGGTLCENVVQAMSRDVLAEAMLRVEDRGIRIGLHCHDEIVAVAPDERAEDALAIVVEELRRRPSWAMDCPLDAEGKLSERYTK